MDTTDVATWTDKTYPLPTGADARGKYVHEWARNTFERIERWGRVVANGVYVEEEGRTAAGRRTDTIRAMRFECTVDGRHHVVIRHRFDVITPDPWSVTVDGEACELPPMAGQMWWWKLAAIALTVHRAAEYAARRAA